jgi:hypothetical protein
MDEKLKGGNTGMGAFSFPFLVQDSEKTVSDSNDCSKHSVKGMPWR